MLVGVVSSPVAAAIAPLTAEAKIPFIITKRGRCRDPAHLALSGARVLHAVAHGYPLGKWTAQQGWKKGYSAVSDFIRATTPRPPSSNPSPMRGTDARHGALPDLEPGLSRPSCSASRTPRPDVAFLWVPAGQQATAMLKR